MIVDDSPGSTKDRHALTSATTSKKILGSVTSVAIGVAELRNRGYATGHGAGSARVGLHPRHAQLAVNAAVTWCQLILDTLADTNAPWRSRTANTAS